MSAGTGTGWRRSGGALRVCGLVLAGALGVGCGSSGGTSGSGGLVLPPAGAPTVFVVTTDFDTGSFAVFPTADSAAIQRNVALIHSDAVARAHDGLVYVVNRLGGDNVQALDPAAGFATVWQCSVGNGSNPHDIAFVSPTKAYVTLYGEPGLAVIDPTTGPDCARFRRGTIDLAGFGDRDGVPEMDQAIVLGDRLYVTVQRLDRFDFFRPTGESAIAVIDTATDTLVDVDPATAAIDGIALTGTNPFAGSRGLDLDPTTGDLLIGAVGDFAVIGDGGIERVDLATNRSDGFIVTEADLGGNVTDFALVGDEQGYAILLDDEGVNRVVRFDPSRRLVTRTLVTSPEFLVDLELAPGGAELYLTDRTLRQPGIRIFRTDDDVEVTTAPIDTGLPPFDVVFLGGDAPPPGGGVVVTPGFYVGATTEGEPISLEVASIDTVFVVCGGRTVQADAGGEVAANGAFAVSVDGIAIDGRFGAGGEVAGTLAGAGCSADFTATRRPGASDTDGDGVPDLVDPDVLDPVCGDGDVEGDEECDGDPAPCGPEATCGPDCRCRFGPTPTPAPTPAPTGTPGATPTLAPTAPGPTPTGGGVGCGTAAARVALATDEPIGAAQLLLDYPAGQVDLPGTGDAPSVVDRITIETPSSLFGGGAPNDQEGRVLFTLIALDGVAAGPLLRVTFDCLGAAPDAGDFACTLEDAVAADGVTPVPDATCTVTLGTE